VSGKESKGIVKEVIGTAGGVLVAEAIGRGWKRGRKLMFRWRRALTPLWFGFLIFLTCVVWRWQIPQWWPVVLTIPVGGGLLAIFGPKLSDRWSRVVMALVPSGLDKGKDGVLDRLVERIYFGTLTTYIGGYMVLRIVDGSSSFSGYMWQIGVAGFGGAWWYHRRVRVAGRADRFAKKWPKLSDKETCPPRLVPLVGSKVVDARAFGKTSVLKIRLGEGHTVDSVSHLRDALASFFAMRPQSVFIAPDQDQARNVVMTFLPKDPWSGKIAHPVFTGNDVKPGETSLKSMGKRFSMGLYAHGERIMYQLQHTLVVGASGSGKSGWLHALMTWLVSFCDVVVVGIDMAAGATLGVWRKTLALPLAEEIDAAIIILERVFGVIRDREARLGLASEDDDDAEDSFEPSRKTPWLILVIDEFPDLLAEAKNTTKYNEDGKADGNYLNYVIALLSRIAKKARKCGIRIVIASQNGTKADLGSKEMQAQLRAIVGLSLDPQQSKNLWQNDMHRGWNSTNLRDGQFLLKDDEHGTPDPGKGYWVENKDRRDLVKKVAPKGYREVYLEPSAWAILTGEVEPETVEGEVIAEETFGPEYAVLEYLRVEAKDGAKVETISDVLTRAKEETGGTGPGTSRATIYRHLEKLEKGDLVIRNGGGEGFWKAAPVTPTSPVPEPRTETEGPLDIASIQGEAMSK
jgi:hypothetical protein